MNVIARFGVLAAIAMLMGGCATPIPTRAELEALDYGEYPNDPDSEVRTYLQTRLRDPETARLRRFVDPVSIWVSPPFSSPVHGWGVCYRLNARNGFGGYTGESTHFFVLRDGQVRYAQGASGPDDRFADALARGFCDDAEALHKRKKPSAD